MNKRSSDREFSTFKSADKGSKKVENKLQIQEETDCEGMEINKYMIWLLYWTNEPEREQKVNVLERDGWLETVLKQD